jgi:hypothetical protein
LYSEPLPIPDFISINPPPNSEISNETEVFISVLPGVLGLEDINSTMASTMIRINNVIYEDIYKRNNFNYVDIGPHGSEQYTTSFTLPQGQDDIVLLRLEFSRNVLSRKIDGIYSYEWVYKVNQN